MRKKNTESKQLKKWKRLFRFNLMLLLALGIVLVWQHINIVSCKNENKFLHETTQSLLSENETLKAETDGTLRKEFSSSKEKIKTLEEENSLLQEKISSLKDEINSLDSKKTLPLNTSSLSDEDEVFELLFWEHNPHYTIIDESQHVYADVKCSQQLDIRVLDTNIYYYSDYPLEDNTEVFVYSANGQPVFSPEPLALEYDDEY